VLRSQKVELVDALKEMTEKLSDVLSQAETLRKSVDEGDTSRESGVSFLEVCHLVMQDWF
jgi:hypothetical protein